MSTQTNDERRGATSASNAAADALCAGRHLAQKGLPEVKGPDADFGRAIHAALAVVDDNAAQNLKFEHREIFDACRAIEKKVIAQFFGGEPAPSPSVAPHTWREQRYWCMVPDTDGKPRYEHSAKPDYVGRRGMRALILEYKTLAGDVPSSPTNLQLRDQVVLVAGNLLVPEIGVAVIQPLVTHSPEICLYDQETIKRAEAEMWIRVRASNDPKSRRSPGAVQCKFCLAKNICAEYQRWAGGMVPGMLNILEVPVASWTPEQRAIFCERRSIAQKWLDETQAQIEGLLLADVNAVPGWALEPGAIRETITDPQAVCDRFVQLGGSREDFLKTVSVAKQKLREQVFQTTGAKGKALEQAMATLLEGLVKQSQNKSSLKRVEEK